METLTIQNVVNACKGTFFGPDSILHLPVSSVVIDSRKSEEGSLFVALKGQRVDGHSFIPAVMESGALCAVCEHSDAASSYPHIVVGSTHQALKDIAAFYRRSLPVRVVGISGSVGKTSTKEMIASILSQKYTVLKTDGNYNNEIGLPLTVFRLRKEHEIAVLEMGISDFGEMTRLSAIARPDVAVLTNIGYAHLENLGSRDGILKAKTEMLEQMPDGSLVFLNGKDDKLAGFTVPSRLRGVYYNASPYEVLSFESMGLHGTKVRFRTPRGEFEALIPIPGEHMIENALAGIAVGEAFDLSVSQIKAGIESLQAVSGRNHIIEARGFTVIDDCYNANPASMKASLTVLSQAAGRKVAVLGDMFELGDNEKALHREIGAHAVSCGTDVLICIGTLSRETAEGAGQYAKETGRTLQIVHFHDKEAFLRKADSLLSKGDTILIKASHGMHFSELVEGLTGTV